jgi:hypothetical protein
MSVTPANTALIHWRFPSADFGLEQNTNLNTAIWTSPPEPIGSNGPIKYIIANAPVRAPLTGSLRAQPNHEARDRRQPSPLSSPGRRARRLTLVPAGGSPVQLFLAPSPGISVLPPVV